MEPSMASDERVSMAKGWRDGLVHQYSTPNQRGRCCAGSSQQRNTEGFLPAQTVLNYNTTKKHRAQQRHFREKRREQQRVYTSSIRGTNDEEIQSFRLVSRPTQRDIFWDETKGQCLDLRELLQPTPPPTDPHLTDEMKRPLHPDNESKFGAKGRTDNGLAQGTQGGFSWDMNVRTTNPVRGQINPLPGSDYTTWQENLPWLQDFRTQEKKHVNSHNVLEEGWGRKQWLVTSSRGLRWGEGEMGVDTDGYVNPAQKRNS
ncbi:uncharacterized protein LOC113587039 isoform X2 [Electrophorus electricus]|uniref:uncharacterized protein LOC113587039 isoform X2 n=1 Tax=Electrophorus electricus TaxID=8005 RepID=UPI0015CFB02E|nr:uncharacterized protein LOC113587039 isoform X2 [Electrophorus electricus]